MNIKVIKGVDGLYIVCPSCREEVVPDANPILEIFECPACGHTYDQSELSNFFLALNRHEHNDDLDEYDFDQFDLEEDQGEVEDVDFDDEDEDEDY